MECEEEDLSDTQTAIEEKLLTDCKEQLKKLVTLVREGAKISVSSKESVIFTQTESITSEPVLDPILTKKANP